MCGLLWCFYLLLELSFWRHPFTAEAPLVSKWCNATFLQICSDEEIKSLDGLKVSKFASYFWVNYSFKSCITFRDVSYLCFYIHIYHIKLYIVIPTIAMSPAASPMRGLTAITTSVSFHPPMNPTRKPNMNVEILSMKMDTWSAIALLILLMSLHGKRRKKLVGFVLKQISLRNC